MRKQGFGLNLGLRPKVPHSTFLNFHSGGVGGLRDPVSSLPGKSLGQSQQAGFSVS